MLIYEEQSIRIVELSTSSSQNDLYFYIKGNKWLWKWRDVVHFHAREQLCGLFDEQIDVLAYQFHACGDAFLGRLVFEGDDEVLQHVALQRVESDVLLRLVGLRRVRRVRRIGRVEDDLTWCEGLLRLRGVWRRQRDLEAVRNVKLTRIHIESLCLPLLIYITRNTQTHSPLAQEYQRLVVQDQDSSRLVVSSLNVKSMIIKKPSKRRRRFFGIFWRSVWKIFDS